METYVQNIATKTGVNPANIIAIIQAILAALGPVLATVCPPTPTPAKDIFAKAGTFWGQWAILKGMRSEGYGVFHKDHAALRTAFTEEAPNVSEEDGQMLLAMAK